MEGREGAKERVVALAARAPCGQRRASSKKKSPQLPARAGPRRPCRALDQAQQGPGLRTDGVIGAGPPPIGAAVRGGGCHCRKADAGDERESWRCGFLSLPSLLPHRRPLTFLNVSDVLERAEPRSTGGTLGADDMVGERERADGRKKLSAFLRVRGNWARKGERQGDGEWHSRHAWELSPHPRPA
jgi:hypothetical protein